MKNFIKVGSSAENWPKCSGSGTHGRINFFGQKTQKKKHAVDDFIL